MFCYLFAKLLWEFLVALAEVVALFYAGICFAILWCFDLVRNVQNEEDF